MNENLTKGRVGPAMRRHAIRGNFLVHVDIARILGNKETGSHENVCVVRRISAIKQAIRAREIMWDGPSRFVHHEYHKIEGTNVQNWVETDMPLTLIRDGKSMAILNDHFPMTKHIKARHVIHVNAPTLLANRKNGTNDPVIAVRNVYEDWSKPAIMCRSAEWSGPTRLCHRPTTPIPTTNGRGVAFVETDAPIMAWVDGIGEVVID